MSVLTTVFSVLRVGGSIVVIAYETGLETWWSYVSTYRAVLIRVLS